MKTLQDRADALLRQPLVPTPPLDELRARADRRIRKRRVTRAAVVAVVATLASITILTLHQRSQTVSVTTAGSTTSTAFAGTATGPVGDPAGIRACRTALGQSGGGSTVSAGFTTNEAKLFDLIASLVKPLTSTVPLPKTFATSNAPVTLCYFDGTFECPSPPGRNPDRVFGYLSGDGTYRNIGCGTDETIRDPSAISTSDESGSTPTTVTASAAALSCLRPWRSAAGSAPEYLGATEAEAQTLATSNSDTLTVYGRDGTCPKGPGARTGQLDPHRISAYIDNGVITLAYRG